jgi:uncharacterized iron-regulated protein
MLHPALLLALALLPAAVLARPELWQLEIGDPARKGREVPVVVDAITDTASGEIIAPRELARRLADAGILFVGESHESQAFHDVQRQVLEALREAGREVLLGVEMFPYTAQAVLDDWNARRIPAEAFPQRSRWYENWSYNWNYYRDVFVYAQANGIGIHAVNCPREAVKAVRKDGFGALTPEQAAHLPPALAADSQEHRRLYRASFGASDAVHMDERSLEGMYRAQTMWDACMGWNALQALRQHGSNGAIIVVLLGTGHVAFGLGAERQIAAFFDGRIASLIPVVAREGASRTASRVRASYASFVWGVPPETGRAYPTLGVSLMGRFGPEPSQIIRVESNSVASRSGLRVGDVILSVNGIAIDSESTLHALVADWRWGEVARARIRRDGREQNLVIPIRRPAE